MAKIDQTEWFFIDFCIKISVFFVFREKSIFKIEFRIFFFVHAWSSECHIWCKKHIYYISYSFRENQRNTTNFHCFSLDFVSDWSALLVIWLMNFDFFLQICWTLLLWNGYKYTVPSHTLYEKSSSENFHDGKGCILVIVLLSDFVCCIVLKQCLECRALH